ncbi:MAG: acyltransferase [Verrucomicrobia bacterium]|nr:acyltransferase [Verrucomicrobiota bacterium]
MKKKLKASAVQMESAPGDKESNFRVMEELVKDAAGEGVELVVFPECCVSGYWFIRNLKPEALDALSEPIPGPSTERLRRLAVQFRMTLGAGWVERGESGQYHNSYVVALPDGRWFRHRKIHAFEHPLIRGGSELTVFDLPGGFRAGVLICYDCNLIENVRMTALRGAEVLLAPHQTGAVRSRNPHLMGMIDRQLWDQRRENPEAIEREFRSDKGRGWLMRWLPSRAHDNGLFLIFSNGVGVDDDEIRTGNAMILDPYGRVLSETWKASDERVTADLDGSLLDEATGRIWIQARRPELYHPLTVPLGIEKETRALKFQE